MAFHKIKVKVPTIKDIVKESSQEQPIINVEDPTEKVIPKLGYYENAKTIPTYTPYDAAAAAALGLLTTIGKERYLERELFNPASFQFYKTLAKGILPPVIFYLRGRNPYSAAAGITLENTVAAALQPVFKKMYDQSDSSLEHYLWRGAQIGSSVGSFLLGSYLFDQLYNP